MPSQGLGPRQSVLPLLISFLFSHIVLAELSFPSPSPSIHPPPSPVLSLPIILFPPPFFFSRFPFTSLLVVSLYLPACALSRTVGIRACDSRREGGSSYSRFSPRRFSPFASSRSICTTTWLRPANPHLLNLSSCVLLSYQDRCNANFVVFENYKKFCY